MLKGSGDCAGGELLNGVAEVEPFRPLAFDAFPEADAGVADRRADAGVPRSSRASILSFLAGGFLTP